MVYKQAKKEQGKLPAREGARADWMRSNAQYISGRSHLDEFDLVAREIEAYWGCDRLRLLLSVEHRERFDRRRYELNRAIWEGDLEDVRREVALSIKAWRACHEMAKAAGHRRMQPDVWEMAMPDGSVLVLCRNMEDMQLVRPDGRKMAVWSLEEVCNMIANNEVWASAVKIECPGAKVTRIRQASDPLSGLDADRKLDDPIPI